MLGIPNVQVVNLVQEEGLGPTPEAEPWSFAPHPEMSLALQGPTPEGCAVK